MGDVGEFFQGLIDDVSEFIDRVVAEIGDILEDIGNFFEDYWEELLITAVGIVLVFTPLGSVALSGLADMAAWIGSEVAFFIDAPLTGLSKWTMTLQDFWFTFAEFTHLSAILAVHNIAQILSPEYREMVVAWYDNIIYYSSQIGLGAFSIASLIENTRTLVFDVSSTFGMSYDMCELTWVNDMATISSLLNEKANEYRNNPGQLIADLHDSIQRPKIDAKQGFVGSLYGSIEGAINLVDSLAGHTETIAEDLYRLFSELPDFVETDWTGDIIDASEGVMTYIETQINPIIGALETNLSSLVRSYSEIFNRTVALEGVVARPGSLLANIRLLPQDEQPGQYQMVHEIANHQLNQDLPRIREEAQEITERLESIAEAVRAEKLPPTQLPTELPGLIRPVGVPAVPRKTWNVGEY